METNMWTYRGDPAPHDISSGVPFYEPRVIEEQSALEQVAQIMSDLQSEGMTGLVERTEILRRYPEYCWMHGWVPLSENHLFEALGKVAAKRRPWHIKQRITCYVIPEAPRVAAAQTAHRAKLEAIVSGKPLRQTRLRRAA